MSHGVGADASFAAALRQTDLELCSAVQRAGCPNCLGKLDRSDYPRKARGGGIFAEAELDREASRRLSLCCRQEGCRRRATPPSVRFLGRRLYLAPVVLLAPCEIVGSRGAPPPPLTVRRWTTWWRTAFAGSSVFQGLRGRLARPVDPDRLPLSLVERLGPITEATVHRALRILSGLSTGSVQRR